MAFGKIKPALAKSKRPARLSGEQGQAVLEYVLLLATIVSVFLILARSMREPRVAEAIRKPFTEDYRRAYQNGHPKAKSYEDGDPYMHPRAGRDGDETNFRIFFNPEAT